MTRTVAQLRALFVRERDAFARTFPRVRKATLSVSWARCISPQCAPRDYAYAVPDECRIVLSHRARSLPLANLKGILRHELGHLADKRPRKRGAEQRADDIAEEATGARIRYDARDVQIVGRGQYPRPTYLHR